MGLIQSAGLPAEVRSQESEARSQEPESDQHFNVQDREWKGKNLSSVPPESLWAKYLLVAEVVRLQSGDMPSSDCPELPRVQLLNTLVQNNG